MLTELDKITPKIHWLCFILIDRVLLSLLCFNKVKSKGKDNTTVGQYTAKRTLPVIPLCGFTASMKMQQTKSLMQARGCDRLSNKQQAVMEPPGRDQKKIQHKVCRSWFPTTSLQRTLPGQVLTIHFTFTGEGWRCGKSCLCSTDIGCT